MNRVAVKPTLLQWACERAGLNVQALSASFPRLQRWVRGDGHPTLKQLEAFAAKTHTPVGYLLLAEPPVENVPIPDFRTVADVRITRPSANLLDTLYLCQQRQVWYRDEARMLGEPPLAFVASAQVGDTVVATARAIRDTLGFSIADRARMPTWEDALREFVRQADDAGVLTMVNGVVGSSNHRKLDTGEFRGFALSDDLAPLVFVNGRDTKSAQMFTLAHELAHIWLGQSALTDATTQEVPDHVTEGWCNRVAAELLVPEAALREQFRPSADVAQEKGRLAREYKVSTLVVLRRLHDIGALADAQYWPMVRAETAFLAGIRRSPGGDFYRTLGVRTGRRFARALVSSTLEGRASYSEAFRLLGFRKMATFRELGDRLGLGF